MMNRNKCYRLSRSTNIDRADKIGVNWEKALKMDANKVARCFQKSPCDCYCSTYAKQV